ncbi:MAG: hypothetical protein M1821_002659 [Bathelium mastoideum]|nr:MAG: hypothetical protein M1821_002659 [Bathelium mastoideum]
MRCDGRKPRCSHCITYETDCTFTAPSRRPAPKRRRNHAKAEDGISNTQDRLVRLEMLVQQVVERLDVAERDNEVQVPLLHQEATAITTATPPTISSSEHEESSLESMALPPLQQVLSVIQVYLRGFNSVLPLFHAETLLQLVHDYYNLRPPHRDPVVWAAINVVLALAKRHNHTAGHDLPSSAACLSRAESVLSRVALGDIQLLNIQVLVGMVMLLQASQNIQPALILIATTIRLAHAIGLHDCICSAHLDSIHAKQRAYVFWLAYILDKDLSMRSKQPSIQVDDDVNLDLPWPIEVQHDEERSGINSTGDTTGCIITTDGISKMNYLVARVQLAAIEGGVYDYVYSTRSRKRSAEERSRAWQSVAHALEKWKVSIPSEFDITTDWRRVPPDMLWFLGELQAKSLACTTLLNQADAWDVEWVASIRRYGKQGIEPLLPPKWDVLVGEARNLLVLYRVIGETDRCNFW